MGLVGRAEAAVDVLDKTVSERCKEGVSAGETVLPYVQGISTGKYILLVWFVFFDDAPTSYSSVWHHQSTSDINPQCEM